MNEVEYKVHCLTQPGSTSITESKRQFGLIVEIEEDRVLICQSNRKYAVKEDEIETETEIRKGLWISFFLEQPETTDDDDDESIEYFGERSYQELKDVGIDKEYKPYQIKVEEDQKLFPKVDKTAGGLVTTMTLIVKPSIETPKSSFYKNWYNCAFSNEWGRVHDPEMILSNWCANRVYLARIQYNPGCFTNKYDHYHWEIVSVRNCEISKQILAVRAPFFEADRVFTNFKQKQVESKEAKKGVIARRSKHGGMVTYQIATKDGKLLKLVSPDSNAEIGRWVEYKEIYGSAGKATFIRYPIISSFTDTLNVISVNDSSSDELVVKFNFVVTPEIKKHIDREDTFFTIKFEPYGKVIIDMKKLTSLLINCPDFTKNVNELHVGYEVIGNICYCLDNSFGDMFFWHLNQVFNVTMDGDNKRIYSEEEEDEEEDEEEEEGQ